MYFPCTKHTGMGKEAISRLRHITAHIRGKGSLKKRKPKQGATQQWVRIPLHLSTLLSLTRKDVIWSLSCPVLEEHFTMTSTAPLGMSTVALRLGSGVCFCRNSPLSPLTALQQASQRSLRERELYETKHENAFQECTDCTPDINSTLE